MGKDIPLGRILGIKLGLDVSLFLMAALITFALGNSLPNVEPGHPDAVYWIAGVVGAILLFLSVLVHEIGHALVAQDEGIEVEGMTLNVLGGVTRMRTSPAT